MGIRRQHPTDVDSGPIERSCSNLSMHGMRSVEYAWVDSCIPMHPTSNAGGQDGGCLQLDWTLRVALSALDFVRRS